MQIIEGKGPAGQCKVQGSTSLDQKSYHWRSLIYEYHFLKTFTIQLGFRMLHLMLSCTKPPTIFSCFQCFEDLQNVSNHPIHILIRSNSMTLSSSSSNLSLTKKMFIFVFQQFRIYRFANWAVSRSILVSLDVLVWRLHALKCPKDL